MSTADVLKYIHKYIWTLFQPWLHVSLLHYSLLLQVQRDHLANSGGGGGFRYAGVHMNNGFEFTLKHILVNHPLNKKVCLKFDPLNRFESKEFE